MTGNVGANASKVCNFYLISFYFYHYYLGNTKINTLHISYRNKNHEKDTFFGKQYAPPIEKSLRKALNIPFFRIYNPEKNMQEAEIEDRQRKIRYAG
jgi:hypothetical protein